MSQATTEATLCLASEDFYSPWNLDTTNLRNSTALAGTYRSAIHPMPKGRMGRVGDNLTSTTPANLEGEGGRSPMPSPAAINPRSVAIYTPSNAIFGENDASAHILSKMMRRVCSGLRARNGSDDNSFKLRVRLAANRCVCGTAINNSSSRR